MKNKENIIHDMCITYRHDYGLLPEEEKSTIIRKMRQLYDNCIEPHMKMKEPEFVDLGFYWTCDGCKKKYTGDILFCWDCFHYE